MRLRMRRGAVPLKSRSRLADWNYSPLNRVRCAALACSVSALEVPDFLDEFPARSHGATLGGCSRKVNFILELHRVSVPLDTCLS